MSRALAVFVILSGIGIVIFVMRLPDYVFSTIGLTLTIAACLLILATCIIYIWLGVEHALTRQAGRQKAQAEAKAARYVSHQDGFGMIHLHSLDTDIIENLSAFPGTHHNGRWEEPHPAAAAAWFALVARRGSESPVNMLPALPSPQLDLLPLLDKAKRVLVHSASEAGKTTLLQHIAARSKNVIIVDPHYRPDKWPSGRVVGKARGFEEIAEFLAWLDTELDRRSQRLAAGDDSFQELTIIIDELSTIRLHCGPAAMKPLAMMIMESAKFGFRLFVGGHSKLVELLGLRGMGDIREGLFMVHLEYNQVTGERKVMIDAGNGPQECQFPPFYTNGHQSGEPVLPDLVLRPGESPAQLDRMEQDAKFVELVNEGKSRNAASLIAYGRRYAGDLVDRGRGALGEI